MKVVRKNSTCEAPKQIRERSKLPGLQQCRTGRERHTHARWLSLASSPDLTPNLETLGALGLRPPNKPGSDSNGLYFYSNI